MFSMKQHLISVNMNLITTSIRRPVENYTPLFESLSPISTRISSTILSKSLWNRLRLLKHKHIFPALMSISITGDKARHFEFRRITIPNQTSIHFYRPHPKDGEGNVFSLSTLGGGVRSESSRGGIRSESRGSGQSIRGGGSVQPGGGVSQRGGGVSILRPLAGGMPLAFTQEDFLVCYCRFLLHGLLSSNPCSRVILERRKWGK